MAGRRSLGVALGFIWPAWEIKLSCIWSNHTENVTNATLDIVSDFGAAKSGESLTESVKLEQPGCSHLRAYYSMKPPCYDVLAGIRIPAFPSEIHECTRKGTFSTHPEDVAFARNLYWAD